MSRPSLRQLRNEDYFLKRELPPTARPYREEFHNLRRIGPAYRTIMTETNRPSPTCGR